jgi:hypothetical protein
MSFQKKLSNWELGSWVRPGIPGIHASRFDTYFFGFFHRASKLIRAVLHRNADSIVLAPFGISPW